LTTQEIGSEWCTASVRCMDQLRSCHALELSPDQVLSGAIAVGSVGQLAWFCLDQGDKFGHCLGGSTGIDHQHVGHEGHGGDRCEVLGKIVSQLLVDTRCDGVMHSTHQQ